MEKLNMIINVISVLLILLIIAVICNTQGLKIFKSDENLKKTLLYKLPITMFSLNMILSILAKSFFNNWLINLILILIPLTTYLFNKYLNNK